ncbi:MAG: DNA cytosine methyltransferase [[Actinobacillus] rossii]|uniref:Cytosine-specific methyltransferase n=1 Tax=[Actinobacillus] rossii TaxID=123820 RepID=A0A380TQN1_9PAST|nr:DNA cytosine methyltransferase [[Actinobacillus] rossii]MDY4506768.1 DNA cytosine methyltransferase [[Actinobacillus] rossii]SUT89357.1 modification methylase [[Actinobacillus] rossii]
MKAIDLFSGCGGFSLGFIEAGFEITKAVEFDATIAKSYIHNHPNTIMFNDDIKNVDNISNFSFNEVEVIIGGPPCQGFSMAGARNRNGFIDDERNYLFKHYFNIVKLIKPKVFVMENVKGILSMKNGEIFAEIKRLFSDSSILGGDEYYLHQFIVNSSDFGLPQKRERVIIIGVLNQDLELNKIIRSTKTRINSENNSFFAKVSIRDAISNLPNPTDSGVVELQSYNTKYQEYLKNNDNRTFNHIKTNHSEKALKRMRKIGIDQNYKALSENINSVHSGSYGRLNYDGLAQTITTRFDTPSGGKFIHPEFNRTITPREAARIQGFPDSFEFIGSRTSICKQIGNAVPVKVSYFFARVVKEILNDHFN